MQSVRGVFIRFFLFFIDDVFQIYDPTRKRYEVPFLQLPDVRSAAKSTLYDFEYRSRPFGFRVVRKDNGEIM